MIAEFEGGGGSAFRPYALDLAHKHVSEMQRYARLAHPPIFAPSVANTYRGMVVEVPLPLQALPRRPVVEAVREVLLAAYEVSQGVRVADDMPAVVRIEDDAGRDRLTLRVRGRDAAGKALMLAPLDNPGQGDRKRGVWGKGVSVHEDI